MPVHYSYPSMYDSDRTCRPMLRSRTQTFVDLSSRYSAPSVENPLAYSSGIQHRRVDSGRVTTAYAITVTAVNNRKDNRDSRVSRGSEDDRVTIHTSNNSAVVRVVTIKRPYFLDKPLPLTPTETPDSFVHRHPRVFPKIDDANGETRLKPILRVSRGSKISSTDITKKALELNVVNVDGKELPFGSLFFSSPDLTEKEKQPKVMTVFIRGSSCCRLRRVLVKKFLALLSSTTALPASTRLIIIWCGNHNQLRRLIQSTQCPFPIYADPNSQIYQLLENTRIATGVEPNHTSVQHMPCSTTATLANLAQSARLLKQEYPLKPESTSHLIGTAFLFEAIDTTRDSPLIRITWSYQIASLSVHSEVDTIRQALGIRSAGIGKLRRSKTSMRDSQRIDQEKALRNDTKDCQKTISCIYGWPARRNSHRRTTSCTEGIQIRRARISCLAC